MISTKGGDAPTHFSCPAYEVTDGVMYLLSAISKNFLQFPSLRQTSAIASDLLLGHLTENDESLMLEMKDHAASKLQRFTDFRKPNGKNTVSGILAPLCIYNSQLSLLYTLRTGTVASHQRQVSFPGGKHDKGDADLVATALRETEEEIGFPSSFVDVWGNMHPVLSGTRKTIIPVVGYIGHVIPEELKTNPDEVDSVFVIPMERLLDPGLRSSTKFRMGYALPAFLGGQYRVWGVTAVITEYILHVMFGCDLTSLNIPSRKFWV